MFQAIFVENDEQGYRSHLASLDEDQLPEGDVVVDVSYSTLNYKDCLGITGQGKIIRQFPLVAGIDFVGSVSSSSCSDYKIGDKVLLNGGGIGEKYWGGLSQKISVQKDWIIPLPEGLSEKTCMAIGTAGYTAMMAIMALEKHGLTPEQGDVLVTGANGGVGSFSISLLHSLGYRVIASTGRIEEKEYLQGLGAAEVIDRHRLSEAGGKPLQKEQWAAAIDSVGSHTLVNVCAGIYANGSVAACGLAQGMDFHGTVAPFILRGVNLLGINSVTPPQQERIAVWKRLSQVLDQRKLEVITHEIALSEVIQTASDLLKGKVRGRIVVDVNR